MAETIRTKPSKTSRATLRELEAKGVLTPCMTGLRHFIRAETSVVEQRGFDHWRLGQDPERLPNFELGMMQCQAWVGYDGGRAHLTAVTGRSYGRAIRPDFHVRFPVNQLAGQLIQSPGVRGADSLPDDGLLYGDAVLVTDMRRHWILSCRNAEEGEVEILADGMVTPRTLIKGFGVAPDILFHQEPAESDLIFIKLRWS